MVGPHRTTGWAGRVIYCVLDPGPPPVKRNKYEGCLTNLFKLLLTWQLIIWAHKTHLLLNPPTLWSEWPLPYHLVFYSAARMWNRREINWKLPPWQGMGLRRRCRRMRQVSSAICCKLEGGVGQFMIIIQMACVCVDSRLVHPCQSHYPEVIWHHHKTTRDKSCAKIVSKLFTRSPSSELFNILLKISAKKGCLVVVVSP